MYAPDRGPGTDSSAPGSESSRNTRYAYLVGRLRARQMTMEEATELFTVMQGMLQASEAARIAMMRSIPAAPSAPRGLTEARPPAPRPPGGGADDLFLVGLLAMGAGAGLLAAMTKRIQEATPPSGPPATSASSSSTPSKKV